jgi:hypothetical protein
VRKVITLWMGWSSSTREPIAGQTEGPASKQRLSSGVKHARQQGVRDMAGISQKKKPAQQRTTIKTLADHANRGLPPESELRPYEFASGMKSKKAGKGAYASDGLPIITDPVPPSDPVDPPIIP